MLYSVFTGYNAAAFGTLATQLMHPIQIVSWEDSLHTQNLEGHKSGDVIFTSRGNFNFFEFVRLVKGNKANVVFLSGWMDKLYLLCALWARARGISVIVGIDTHWRNNIRQRFFAWIMRPLSRLFFSHAFVAGAPQREYAVQLGIPESRIATGAYTCDSKKFVAKRSYVKNKSILFVGRYELIKGVDILVNSFREIILKYPQFNDWTLYLAGTGSLRGSLATGGKIIEMGFLRPEELNEMASRVDFFCLPSRFEPWGLVVHEAASCGLPLLLSDACGAKEDFLDEGKNGISFHAGDARELTQSLLKMMNLSESELEEMGTKSVELAKKNSLENWTKKLIELMHC